MVNRIGTIAILYSFFWLGDKIGHHGVMKVLDTIWIFN